MSGDYGLAVSDFAVWNVIDRAALSFTKSIYTSDQDGPDVARRRIQWPCHQREIGGGGVSGGR